MKRRRRLLLDAEENENFWPSFTDLTSTIALILFVLVLLAYIQNLVSAKNLGYVKAELQRTIERLQGSRREVSASEAKLRLLAAEIAEGQARLRLSEERVQQQQQVISESNSELAELRARLEGIAVLRLDVLQKVKRSIETQLGAASDTAPLVTIAENGNIVIDESLLFEYDSHTIKREGKPFLNTLATAFENVLADPNVRENIDVVLVQGHTDERGSVSYNRELSGRRANAVLNHMFEASPGLSAHGSFFASSAYSEFRPVKTEKNEDAYRQNRRIEISVVLRDANVRGVIDEYMQQLDPALRGGQPSQPPQPSQPSPPSQPVP